MEGKGQVIARVAAVIAAIERRGTAGARLLDLANETGIARPSVHRLLQELAAVGYVKPLPNRRYCLGPALYGLSLSVPSPDFRKAEPLLRDLATLTGDTVYLGLRQRDTVHYLLRADGSYPIRAQIVDVGQIIPLGMTFAGIALLAGDGDAEIAKLIANHDPRAGSRGGPLADLSARAAAILAQCHQMRIDGYCYSRNLVWDGVSGIATVVPSSSCRPIFAVSISATNERLPESRARELAPHLIDIATQIAMLAI